MDEVALREAGCLELVLGPLRKRLAQLGAEVGRKDVKSAEDLGRVGVQKVSVGMLGSGDAESLLHSLTAHTIDRPRCRVVLGRNLKAPMSQRRRHRARRSPSFQR